MAKILITGGTGLIGNALCKKLLENGHEVSVLTRTLIKSSTIKYFLWNVNKSIIDEKAFDGIEHIVHLAGCGIADKKWTPERMKEILDSRVNASELILSVLKKRNIKLKSFVGASAVGIYSARTSQRIYTENDLGLDDFLSDTCIAWENSYYDLEDFSERYAIARISVVLAKEGGALKKLLPIFKLGLGSGIGTGKQYMPWIHIDDLISIFYEMLFNSAYNGIYNAAATEHVTNYSFSKQLAQSLKRPFFMPLIPSSILKWMYGDMADVILEGSRVSNERLLKQGFVLKYPDLKTALNQICR
jgi:uncharacterized protein (TIGR01777 family)